MSVERALAVALLVLSLAGLALSGPGALRAWRIWAGIGRRRQRDATGRAPAVPPGVVDRIALLADQGYRPLGVTSLDLPDGERFAWILAADDAESYAILAGGTRRVGLTAIYSAWPDGTWLGTHHPMGARLDRQGYHTQVVSTTLAEAAQIHREGLARLRRTHGPPRPIRSMTDMLACDADYRNGFDGARLQPVTARIVPPAVLSACAALAALCFWSRAGSVALSGMRHLPREAREIWLDDSPAPTPLARWGGVLQRGAIGASDA